MNLSLVCERIVFAFALWTIAVQVTAITQGNLHDLVLTAALLGLLACVLGRSGRWPSAGPQETVTAAAPKVQETLFLVLTVAVLILTLTAHRPDEDDALYVNQAVAAADTPAERILHYDRQHRTERDVTIKRSSRLVSLGALAAVASWLSGIPAIYFLHLVFATLAAVLALVANRELFRILAPKHWAFGVLAVVVYLSADGEVHRSYGNFSFVRLHQGKGILLSVFVPLIIAYGLRFARRPSRRGWLRLAAVQVAATGCSSTGILLAPLVAFLAVSAGLGRRAARTPEVLVRCLLSSFMVGAVGLWAKLPVLSAAVGGSGVPERSVDLGKQADFVSGGGRFMAFQLFVILTAWIWCETRIARRLCIVFPCVVGPLFLNQVVADIFGTYLVPPLVYWRVFWLLPLPVMAGLTLLAPLALPRLASARIRYGLFSLLLFLVPGLFSTQLVFSSANGVEMRRPGLKVPREYEVARRVAELVEGRPNVLVPHAVSPWLPTLHRHPYPVLSRLSYANRSRFRNDAKARVALKRLVTGRTRQPMTSEHFRAELDRYGVACVVFRHSNRFRKRIVQGLVAAGFEKDGSLHGYELWVRGGAK